MLPPTPCCTSIKFFNSSITLSIFIAEVNSCSTNKNNNPFNQSWVMVLLCLVFTNGGFGEKIPTQLQIVTGIMTTIFRHRKKKKCLLKTIEPITFTSPINPFINKTIKSIRKNIFYSFQVLSRITTKSIIRLVNKIFLLYKY